MPEKMKNIDKVQRASIIEVTEINKFTKEIELHVPSSKTDNAINSDTEIKFKFMHILYGILGGFYYSRQFQPLMRNLWILLTAICLILTIGTSVGYQILLGKEDLSTTIYAYCILEMQMNASFLIPVVSYYFRNELEMVLQLNEKKNGKKCINEDKTAHGRQLKKNIFRSITLGLILIFFCLVVHLVLPLVTNDEKYFLNVKFYVFPNPYIKKIKSTSQFIFCNIVTFCYQINTVLISLSPGAMISNIAFEFYLSLVDWCHGLAEFSANFKKSHDELNKKYFYPNTEMKISKYKVNIETERQQFMTNMNGTIRDLQSIMRKIEMIKTYIEFQFNIALFVVTFGELFLISTLYTSHIGVLQKVRIILELMITGLLWLGYCYGGRIFSDVEEMIAEQVNNIPWYYLDPQRRKTFCLFLHSSQRPIRFYGLRTYIMGMPIFLRVTKLGYTYFSFLRKVSKD